MGGATQDSEIAASTVQWEPEDMGVVLTRGASMPQYFMHLRDSTDELLDPDGVACRPRRRR
jgi:hypothetical protein